MLDIITAKYILNPTISNGKKHLELLTDYGILYDDKIIMLKPFKDLVKEYPNAKINDYKNSLLTPALANTHTHLEFSTNKSSLDYGSFTKWLKSINKNKANLSKDARDNAIKMALLDIKKSGVGALGEISSFGLDFDALKDTKLKITLFHEILGANENNFENIKNGFLDRFNLAKNTLPSNITHAASIHSTYSLCKKVYDFALDFIKQNNLSLSFHYLESLDEWEFISQNHGKLKEYLKVFNENIAPLNVDYLKDFEALHVIFIHCVFLKDFSALKPNHFIAHCPFSNRLLSENAFDLKKALNDKANITLATDGLSSNISLNIFDEARACILTHHNLPFEILLKEIFFAITYTAHKALQTNSHSLEANLNADFAVFDISDKEHDKGSILSEFLLHTRYAKDLFLNGKSVF